MVAEDRAARTEDDVFTIEQQQERITALAAEWADLYAKAQVEETDRLAQAAFA